MFMPLRSSPGTVFVSSRTYVSRSRSIRPRRSVPPDTVRPTPQAEILVTTSKKSTALHSTGPLMRKNPYKEPTLMSPGNQDKPGAVICGSHLSFFTQEIQPGPAFPVSCERPVAVYSLYPEKNTRKRARFYVSPRDMFHLSFRATRGAKQATNRAKQATNRPLHLCIHRVARREFPCPQGTNHPKAAARPNLTTRTCFSI